MRTFWNLCGYLDMVYMNKEMNFDLLSFERYPVNFTLQIFSGMLLRSLFSHPFHSNRVGRCDIVDV